MARQPSTDIKRTVVLQKTGNNTSGKSDRHQAHERNYALYHTMEANQRRLETWYKKITTPSKHVPKPRKVAKVRVPIKRTPGKGPRPISEKAARRLLDFKVATHWVARNELEYEQMFPISVI